MADDGLNPNRPGAPEAGGDSRPAGPAETRNARLHAVVENVPALICCFRPDGTLTYANARYRQAFGRGGEELIGRGFFDFLPAEEHARVRRAFRSLTPESPTVTYEHAVVGADGKRAWQEWTDHGVFDAEGCPIEYHSIGQDITPRREAEAALRRSEEQHRLVVENAHDAIFIVQDGKIHFPNRRAREMGRTLGFAGERLAFIDFIHPDDRDTVASRHLRRLQGETLPARYSFRLLGQEGKLIWVELNSIRIDWNGRPATLNFLRDITEQKALENQFHQAQKMEAIGNLAGGIAHDFNNLLMCIQGNAAVVLGALGGDHPLAEPLRAIQRSAESGAGLTRQLLGFARRGKYDFKPIDINAAVSKTGGMFQRSRRELAVDFDLEPAPWAVEADEGQIEQVLLNLCVNAWQATGPGGCVAIQTRNLFVSPDNHPELDLPAGRYVRIAVRDNGCGMDEQTLAKIFEPFFTTKGPGIGTGLGLASAYGIVQNHGGLIAASSRKGAGSVFHVYLPAADKEASPQAKPVDKPASFAAPPAAGRFTVLIVDDEREVLETLARILRLKGFRVLAALSGKNAVEIYRTARDPIDIVVLDMLMPEMGGSEAFNRIRQIDPGARFILSSGYSLGEDIVRILDSGGVGFLQKPYHPDLLVEKINGLLKSGST